MLKPFQNLSTRLSLFKKHENEFNEEVALTEIYKYIIKYFDEVRFSITFFKKTDMDQPPEFGYKASCRPQDGSGIPHGQKGRPGSCLEMQDPGTKPDPACGCPPLDQPFDLMGPMDTVNLDE